jgi:hypothetical protein
MHGYARVGIHAAATRALFSAMEGVCCGVNAGDAGLIRFLSLTGGRTQFGCGYRAGPGAFGAMVSVRRRRRAGRRELPGRARGDG